MNLEKALEQCLIASIRKVIPSDIRVRGVWSFATSDAPSEDALHSYCDVRVPTVSFANPNTPIGEWKIRVTFFVPVALDRTGAKMSDAWAGLSSLMWRMQENLVNAREVFTVPGFTLHGFVCEGGTDLDLDEDDRVLPVMLVIRGRFQQQ